MNTNFQLKYLNATVVFANLNLKGLSLDFHDKPVNNVFSNFFASILDNSRTI